MFLALGAFTIEAQEVKWETDINQAIKVSKKSKKPLLLFFTGSDWCGWCIRLQKEVLKTPEFEKWAKENVVLVELDFPRRMALTPDLQKQNYELQQLFKVQGYPTVWFANASTVDGKVNFEQLGSSGYMAGGPSAWIAAADKIITKK